MVSPVYRARCGARKVDARRTRRAVREEAVARPDMGRLRAVGGRAALLGGATLLMLATVEVALRLLGLGHPILYDNRTTYGYRPLPDQSVRRLFGARVHVNHLGFR